jgi:hypothetical protein
VTVVPAVAVVVLVGVDAAEVEEDVPLGVGLGV